MSVETTEKTIFYSGWDIDKLIAHDSKSVSLASFGSSTEVADLTPFGFTEAPKVMALINYGSGLWFLSGGGAFTETERLFLTITKDSIRAEAQTSSVSATVKYWVFSSGIQY